MGSQWIELATIRLLSGRFVDDWWIVFSYSTIGPMLLLRFRGFKNKKKMQKESSKKTVFNKKPFRERNQRKRRKAEKEGGELLGQGRILWTIR